MTSDGRRAGPEARRSLRNELLSRTSWTGTSQSTGAGGDDLRLTLFVGVNGFRRREPVFARINLSLPENSVLVEPIDVTADDE